MRSRSACVVSLLLATGLLACSRAPESAYSSASEEAVAADAAAPAAAPVSQGAATATAQPGVSPDQLASGAVTQVDPQRRFIRTAQARFQVKDVYATALAIEDEVAAQGGFVVNNAIEAQVHRTHSQPIGNGKRLELSEYALQGELTVRVPSERTQSFLRAIASRMEFLEHRRFNAQDAQFELLRQQLAWQRGQSGQQTLAAAVDEGGKLGQKVDAIEARTQALAGRDEALVAQKEFEDRVAFSTITLALTQDAQVRKVERVDVDAVFREHGPGFFTRIGASLQVGWRGVLEMIVALATLWPLGVLLVVALLAWRSGRLKRWFGRGART